MRLALCCIVGLAGTASEIPSETRRGGLRSEVASVLGGLCIARAPLVCVELGGSEDPLWSEHHEGVVSLTTPSSGGWYSYRNYIELSLSINSEFLRGPNFVRISEIILLY